MNQEPFQHFFAECADRPVVGAFWIPPVIVIPIFEPHLYVERMTLDLAPFDA